MKAFTIGISIILMTLFFSCTNDEPKLKEANFSVLGLTSIQINGQWYPITNDVFIDISSNKNMTATGSQYNLPSKSAVLDYVLISNQEQALTCELSSSVPNVTISVNVVSNNGISTCIAMVSRVGYDEKIVYKIVQKVFPD
jgi:hypothetical protein